MTLHTTLHYTTQLFTTLSVVHYTTAIKIAINIEDRPGAAAVSPLHLSLAPWKLPYPVCLVYKDHASRTLIKAGEGLGKYN